MADPTTGTASLVATEDSLPDWFIKDPTPEDSAFIAGVAAGIDFTSYASIASLGADSQNALEKYGREALGYSTATTAKPDSRALVAEIQKSLTELQSAKDPKRFAKKIVEKVMQAREVFQGSVNELTVDFKLNTKAYDVTIEAARMLSLYLHAGRLVYEQAESNPAVVQARQVSMSSTTVDLELANNTLSQLEAFERRLHDMRQALHVNIMQAAQTRLLCTMLSTTRDRLQNITTFAIPGWLASLRIDLGLNALDRALAVSNSVTPTDFRSATDALVTKLGEVLKVYDDKENKKGV